MGIFNIWGTFYKSGAYAMVCTPYATYFYLMDDCHSGNSMP
jgi:hypothetical protein